MLAAAAGGVAYFVTRNQTHTYVVPHLAGLTEAEALNQISGFNWDTVVTSEASDDVAAGIVIRTQPDEAHVARGGPSRFSSSSAPGPRRDPFPIWSV